VQTATSNLAVMHRKAPRLRAMSHEFEFGQRLAKADASSILGPAAVAVAVGSHGRKVMRDVAVFGNWLRDGDSNSEPCG